MSLLDQMDALQQKYPLFPSFQELKAEFPAIVPLLRQEYQRVNGEFPIERGYVYLVHAVGTEFYKIGSDPDRRILQIDPKMPFDVRFIRVWKSDHMSIAEKFLHRSHENCRVNGEWFRLCATEAEWGAKDENEEFFEHYGVAERLLLPEAAFAIRNAYAADLQDRLGDVVGSLWHDFYRKGQERIDYRFIDNRLENCGFPWVNQGFYMCLLEAFCEFDQELLGGGVR